MVGGMVKIEPGIFGRDVFGGVLHRTMDEHFTTMLHFSRGTDVAVAPEKPARLGYVPD